MPTKTKKPRKKTKVWQPITLVHIYRQAKAGLSDEAIARALEINRNTIKLWKKKKPEVVEALSLARQEIPEDGFTSYFYQQLPPKLQKLWAEIETANELGGGIGILDQILADHGKRARQSLFLHALVSSHFSPTRAMEKVGIDRRQLESWIEQDPEFAELVEEIQYHKKNFFEEALVKLVGAGDRAAVMFANRGANRDRGYGKSEDVNVNVNGVIEHRQVLDLTELDLSPACRIEIAAAIRRREDEKERQHILRTKPLEERVFQQIEAKISNSVGENSEG